MAVDMFLKLDGVDGESKDKDHKGWIDIYSFCLGVSNAGAGHYGGGSGAGKASISDITFTKQVDNSSRNTLSILLSGQAYRQRDGCFSQGRRGYSARVSQVRAERSFHHELKRATAQAAASRMNLLPELFQNQDRRTRCSPTPALMKLPRSRRQRQGEHGLVIARALAVADPAATGECAKQASPGSRRVTTV